MFDHVVIRTSDQAASERFYRTVLGPLGIEPTSAGERLVAWDEFFVVAATPERPRTRNLHVGFVAPSREHVDAFWQAGVDAGHSDHGTPGERPEYKPDYYGAFLLDPDGNSAEGVHHGDVRRGGHIDHLWIRVGDLEAAAKFYDLIAPTQGYVVDGAGTRPRAPASAPAGSGAAPGPRSRSSTTPGRRPRISMSPSPRQIARSPDRQTVDDFHLGRDSRGLCEQRRAG